MIDFQTALDELRNKLNRQQTAVRKTESMIEALKHAKATAEAIGAELNAKTPRRQT